MLIRRRGTFLGGAFLPSRKERTADAPIADLSIAKVLWVPLGENAESVAKPAVEAGRHVEAGDVIGQAENGSVPVHAPAVGNVTAVASVPTAEGNLVPAVEIETDPDQHPLAPETAEAPEPSEPTDDEQDQWIEAIEAGGVVGGEGGVTWSRTRVCLALILRSARRRGVKYLLVNGVESEPYLTGTHRLLVEHAEAVLAGAGRLSRLLGNTRICLAVGDYDRALLKRLKGLARSIKTGHRRVRVVGVADKYPACSQRLLVHCLLGRQVPAAGCCADIGVCVLDVRSVLAAEWAIGSGWTHASNVVTIGGELVGQPGNYRIATGTQVTDVLAAVDADLGGGGIVVAGGPFTGRAITDPHTVLTKSTTDLLVLSPPAEAPGPTACVRCGWCLDDCPVGLDALALMNAAELDNEADARRLHVQACIGCGVCSFVCPSRLPMAPSILSLRQRVAEKPFGSSGGTEPPDGCSIER